MRNNNYLSLINFKVKLHRRRFFKKMNTMLDVQFFKNLNIQHRVHFLKEVSEDEDLL